MMKRFSFMFIVLVAFLAPTMATATIYSFTIEGVVSSISDTAGYAAAAAAAARVDKLENVEYVVTVDSDIPGSSTNEDGTTQYLGTIFSSLDKGVLKGYAYKPSDSGNDALNNYVNSPETNPVVCAGNANSNLYLPEVNKGFSQWTEGDLLGSVSEISFAPEGYTSRINLDNATITKVETHATPLPAGILLLGSGVGALALVRRRVKISD
jgi:hypothetical protein